MAGTIAITADDRWSVGSPAFYWVLDELIERVTDGDAAEQLREIRDMNLGWVAVPDFTPAQRAEILRVLGHEIVPYTERTLAPDAPGRASRLAVVGELAAMARAAGA